MHQNIVSMDQYRRRRVKHSYDSVLFERLKGRCSIARIESAQRMCARNIANGTPPDSAMDAAEKWAALKP